MWTKILIYIMLSMVASTSNGAVFECSWVNTACRSNYTITPVTAAYENIILSGKPSGFQISNIVNLQFIDKFVLKYPPTNVFKYFSNLQALTINNCQLKYLVTDGITNCQLLNFIAIENGDIYNIPDGFASSCSKVATLILRRNNIVTIDKNAFRGMTGLTSLTLMFNNVTCIPPDTFQQKPMLEYLFFYYNKINGIDRNLFRELPKLSYMDLSYNSISDLPLLNFTGTSLSKAFTLNLYQNPITIVNPFICTIFVNRPSTFVDLIGITNIPCLQQPTTISSISAAVCLNKVSELKNCFLAWTTNANGSVSCGQTSIPALAGYTIPFAWRTYMGCLA